jgi:uncharacterized protein with GYD domain
MPTYIIRFRFTPTALEKISDSANRLDAFKEFFHTQGVETQNFFLTLGEFDGEIVVTAPDDRTLARTVLAWTSRGSITTQTVRAFTEDEYREICGDLPSRA